MNTNKLPGDFTLNGKTWKFHNPSHMNPMWYRTMTTNEVNTAFNLSLSVPDSVSLTEDDLGFPVLSDFAERPVITIELIKTESGNDKLVASATSGGPNRAGMTEQLGPDFTRPAPNLRDARENLKILASQIRPSDI